MRFEHQVAIVTGGSRGIGFAIAHALRQEGARVVIASRDAETGRQAAREIDARFVACDVSDRTQARALIQTTAAEFGRIDILINNAAIHAAARFEDEPPELWDAMYRVNVLGTVYPSQAVVPLMKQQAGGHIVHIASKAGVVGEPGHAAYSASKGAIIALTRAMAIELAPQRIVVNCVCPGPILTDMLRSVFPNSADREQLGHEAPLGRIGLPADVVGAALLLASHEADWITGQAIQVDGGFSVLK
jgi:NAD(P)-dependent dehydrogenase (short-subunit alcohol dehydrogenase family)